MWAGVRSCRRWSKSDRGCELGVVLLDACVERGLVAEPLCIARRKSNLTKCGGHEASRSGRFRLARLEIVLAGVMVGVRKSNRSHIRISNSELVPRGRWRMRLIDNRSWAGASHGEETALLWTEIISEGRYGSAMAANESLSKIGLQISLSVSTS
jgi:hypothetical protein